MSLAKITNEVTQRIAAHFKPNTFFLHSNRPLPAIVVPLPNRGERNKPLIWLMQGLRDQEGFDFKEKLKSVKIGKEEMSKQRKEGNEGKLTSVCGLTFDQRTTFIASNQEGELILTKQITNPNEVLAVILYSSAVQSPVKALHSRNYENLLFLLRSTATLSLLLVLRELLYSTRLQNHPSTA